MFHVETRKKLSGPALESYLNQKLAHGQRLVAVVQGPLGPEFVFEAHGAVRQEVDKAVDVAVGAAETAQALAKQLAGVKLPDLSGAKK